MSGKRFLVLLAAWVWVIGIAGCEDHQTPDVVTGELVMLRDPLLGATGYKQVELWDDIKKRTVFIPPGKYSTVKEGTDIVVRNMKGQRLAAISLEDAIVDSRNHRFFLSTQKSPRNTLDIYGGKTYRPLKSVRIGVPDQPCTIHCCSTHQKCEFDAEGKEICVDVCDDCRGTQDELWEVNQFRWDYEIFFGKPGDYDVASFVGPGKVYTEKKLLKSESCHQ